LPGTQFLERLGHITIWENFFTGLNIVGEFHHVVEKTGGVIASDVQQTDLRVLAERHRLESLDAGELAVEGTVFVEAGAADDLHRAVNAGDTAREPDFTVGAAAHRSEERVIRNGRGLVWH